MGSVYFPGKKLAITYSGVLITQAKIKNYYEICQTKGLGMLKYYTCKF
jgi:hypothetical protein